MAQKQNREVSSLRIHRTWRNHVGKCAENPVARKMNIAIVKAFIAMRKMLIQYAEVIKVIDDLKERIDVHDTQLNQIYDALENMLDRNTEEENKQKAWSERERIGFKK